MRLKINIPVSLEKQEIWRYDENPVLYDDFLQAHYPFKYPLVREIEAGNYEAYYRIIDANGKERAVVFADDVDTREKAGKGKERLVLFSVLIYCRWVVETGFYQNQPPA